MIRILSLVATLAALAALAGALIPRGKKGPFRAGLLQPLEGRGGPRWVDHCIGITLACIFTAICLATAHNLGFMRDEGMYFDAAKSYGGWFDLLASKDAAVRQSAFTPGQEAAHWAANGEHPSLMKSAFALSWTYLFKSWPNGLIDLFSRAWWCKPLAWIVKLVAKIAPTLFWEESASFRFPGMVAGGLILWITYLFGAEVCGRAAGLASALLIGACPRLFFDAHLACFDAAAALMWLAVAYSFWKGMKSVGWAVASGFVWGLGVLTKHNSWFLPLAFFAYFCWLAYDVSRARPGAPPTLTQRLKRIPIPWPFLFMGMIGPGMFIYFWPRLWFDTWGRIDWYFSFHAHHDYYNIEYLHKTYFQPPFPMSMPYVLILATVPFATLVAMAFGVVSRWRALFAPLLPSSMLEPIADEAGADKRDDVGSTRDDDRRTTVFWFLNMNLPVFIIALPKIPHFGGTKHWHPAYPFLCLFAGAGIVFVAMHLVKLFREHAPVASARRWIGGAAAVMIALVFAPACVETGHSHPHGLSYYAPIVGGTPGGADLGFNRGFWGYETGAMVDWLNQHFPNGGRVYPNDTFFSSWEQLKNDKRLHANIDSEWWSVANADVLVVEHEQHMDEVEHQIWIALGSVTPVYVVQLDGVPLLTVYLNPKSTRFVP